MQFTILGYIVYDMTNSVVALGKLGLFEAISVIACSFVSGHVVDNQEKKKMLLICALGYALVAFILTLAALPHKIGWDTDTAVNVIYFGVFLGGILRAFYSPTAFSLLGLLVPKTHIVNATTWNSTIWQISSIMGPLLGGVILSLLGKNYSLVIVFALIITSVFFIIPIPKQPLVKKNTEKIFQSLATGFKYLGNNQILLSVLALDMFAVLFGGATALLPVFAKDILHVGEVAFGWLRAAEGIGALITMLLLSFIPLKTNPGMKMLGAVAGFGICMIVFGLSTNFILSFSMLLISGMFDAISVIIRGTILQLHTPDEMRGRISAINTMFISSSNEIGAAESGYAARLLGTQNSVVFGGIVTILVVGITASKAPQLKTLNLKVSNKK